MRQALLICGVILASSLSANATNLQVREGRPIVDGVYVTGHGPYRFLLDTGTNVDLIETNLARTIGLTAKFQIELASATGKTKVSATDGVEIAVGSVKADGQEVLFSPLEAIHAFSPDIRGVLGQSFLSRFDYLLDLRGKLLEFGKQDRRGTRAPLRTIDGRSAVSTNFGDLILDSGAARLELFGVEPDAGFGDRRQMQTVAGSQDVGMVSVKALSIEGQTIWHGDAVALPKSAEPGVAGLLPVSLFKTIYVCNSEGYVVVE